MSWTKNVVAKQWNDTKMKRKKSKINKIRNLKKHYIEHLNQ